MGKFLGDIEELKSAVTSTGIVGTWTVENKTAQKYTFRARTGEILNWWPVKGTLLFQGANSEVFAEKLNLSLGAPQPATEITNKKARIFIVHGHDTEARDQLELVLMRLGLQPFILQNSSGGGKTIIEALEKNIYEETAFGIVLMTPDDFGYSKTKGDADRQPRARQNVILEMGMIMATLGRDKMAILKKGALEIPSDCDGILRIEFNGHVKEIATKLAQRIQEAGFDITAAQITAASA
ncbi:MAG: nucleotide-binding protein [Chitinophagaceae bacterium]